MNGDINRDPSSHRTPSTATRLAGLPYPASDWWRGLLVIAQMTGWRIGELLALRWADVNLEASEAVTQLHVPEILRVDVAG